MTYNVLMGDVKPYALTHSQAIFPPSHSSTVAKLLVEKPI